VAEVWTLRDRDGVLATITITDTNFPWLSGHLDAEPRFQEYRPLFTAELAAFGEGGLAGIRPHAKRDSRATSARLAGRARSAGVPASRKR